MSGNETFGQLFTNKMTIDFDMLGTFMKNRIGCNIKSGLVVTEQRNWSNISEVKFRQKRD